MRKGTFFVLLGGTAILITATVVVRQGRAPETQVERVRLVPELAERVNEVARLEVKSKDEEVLLAKRGEGWVVESRGGYPADFQKVKATALTVAEMEVLEPKTSNRELYPRLGVEALDAEGSSSKLLTLSDAEGEIVASLIAGTVSVGRLSGTYVRPPNKAQALLVSGELEVEADPLAWMDRDVVDIPAERVREVVVEAPGEPQVRIHRQDPKMRDYTLDSIPKGEKLRSQIAVNALATGLQQLRFEDVSARADFALPEGRTMTTVRTFDGLQAIVSSAVVEERTHVTLEFEHDAEADARTEASAVDKDSGGEESPPMQGPRAGAKTPEAVEAPAGEPKEDEKLSVAEEVATLNAKVADWVYVLPSYKSDLLTKSMQDLLAEKDEEDSKPAASDPK